MRKNKFPPNIYSKRGIFYFSRRVPKRLQHHYAKPKLAISLGTRSESIAIRRAEKLNDQLETEWAEIRWTLSKQRFALDSAHSIKPVGLKSISLQDAEACYKRQVGDGRSPTFFAAVSRATLYLRDTAGEKQIHSYSRQDANSLRDKLAERGLKPSSIKRIFNTINAILGFACKENDLQFHSAFSGVFLGNSASHSSLRLPIPDDEILAVQNECKEIDDELRRLILLLSDTGMRLSEALGLMTTDIVLNNPFPHVIVTENSWRRLKTPASKRVIPLVGNALWAAKNIKRDFVGEFCFPSYCDGLQTKSNSASAALNKWLKPRVTNGRVIHSFRHSFRDRLRAVECPAEIIDELGGWSRKTVGQGYGLGTSIAVKAKWMDLIPLI